MRAVRVWQFEDMRRLYGADEGRGPRGEYRVTQ
jgi:hypothetical protein